MSQSGPKAKNKKKEERKKKVKLRYTKKVSILYEKFELVDCYPKVRWDISKNSIVSDLPNNPPADD